MSELIFASSIPGESYRISKLIRKNKIRKIAARIYTTNFSDTPAEIIKRNILEIVGNLYPNSVLSHRSAFEFKPTANNQIFVTYSYTKKIKLPGVTINFLKGKSPIEGDNKMIGELYVSSRERALLENLQITKKSDADSKSLGIEKLEEKLEDIFSTKGEIGLNLMRDAARRLSAILDMKREFERLNKIIGAMFATKSSKILKSNSALSRAAGMPFDRARIELFEKLSNFLYNKSFQERKERNLSSVSFRNFAFFESYFSNYIEGTVFEVAEAKSIVDTGVAIPLRSDDSHDILGNYRIVSDKEEMKKIPSSADELLELLQSRHKILLPSRTGKLPGEFKQKNNRAGNTFFVDYKLVRGTLIRAFDYYKILGESFARAAFIKFLISEVHPFEDGNGRIARVMMNAEFVNKSQCKIIIPTALRDDYLLTVKRMTKQADPAAYVSMLSKAHQFSEKLNFENYDEFYNHLKTHNAFYESDEGKKLIIE